VTSWVFARRLWIEAKRELRLRGQSLASAFAWSRSADRAASAPNDSIDLIDALNQVSTGAGFSAWDWDIDGGTFRFNREVMDRFGVEAEAARGDLESLVERSVHVDDRSRFREEMILALKAQRPLCIDYRAVTPDGSSRSAQLRGVIYRRANGRAYRVVGFTSDITPQQEAAAKSRVDANKQRQLFERLSLATEAAGIGVWDWDLETGKLGADANMSSIFKDADFDGVTNAQDFIRKILHPDDRDSFVNTIRNAVAPGGVDRVSANFRYLRSDGGVHHAELHSRVIRNSEGKAIRLLSVSWNVTSKMEAQAELQRRSDAQRVLVERFNLATEVAALDVWDWDLPTDRIVGDVSHPEIYGIQNLDHHGVRALIASLVHPEDAPGYFTALDKAIESGNVFFYRFRVLGRDGSTHHVQSNARIFRNSDGRAIRLLGVSQDVSEEMRHLDELRRQAEEERTLRDRLNLATHTAGIAIWDKDLVRGNFVCNDQFWKMFGLNPNDRLKVHEGIHVEAREQALAPLRRAFDDPTRDEILSVRHRTSNPRSEPQYVQTHMRVFRDASGKVLHLLGVTWDVTAEELRNEELQRQAANERALVDRLNVTTQAAGISPWEFDLKANRFSWHGVRLPVFGLDHVPLEHYMEALLEVTLEEDRHKHIDIPREAYETNTESYQVEFRIRGADGGIHFMRNKCHLLRNAKGKVRYIMGITMDVTKEMEANVELARRDEEKRKLLERLGFAIDSANIGFWEIDLTKNRFLWVENPVSSLGIADADFGSMDEFAKRVLPEDRAVMSDSILKAIKDGSNRFDFRYRAFAADGSVIHIQTFGRVFVDAQGKPIRSLGTSWEVTKEVAVAEQLRKQAETERTLVNRLNVATQAAGISPWEYDLIGNCFSWIGTPLGFLGLDDTPPEQYLNAVSEKVLPEDRHILKQATMDALAKDLDVFSYIYRAYDTRGQLRHLKNFARILRSVRGTPYRLVGVTWDVTEEVAAAERLKQQAEHERKLTERLNIATSAANIASWEIDLVAARFLWIENPIKKVERGDDGNITLKEFSNYIVPDDRDLMPNAIREAIASGSDRLGFRYRCYANDGSILHLQSFSRLILDDAKRPIRVLGVSWDVTPEVEANEKLEQQARYEREMLERLNVATQGAGISMWEFDLKSNRHSWLSKRLAILGLDDVPVDDYYAALREIMEPEDRHLITDVPREAVESGKENYSYQFRITGNDGKLHYLQNYVRVLRSSRGTAYRLVGVTWDATQEVNTTAQLAEQAQKERALTERLSIATQSAGISTWEFWSPRNFCGWKTRSPQRRRRAVRTRTFRISLSACIPTTAI
jgi:PAS domain S-box-containing protein